MSILSLLELKKFGDSVTAASVAPSDLVTVAKIFGFDLNVDTAAAMAVKLPLFITDAGETLSTFVTNGGLLRMLSAQMTGENPHEMSTVRCQHCGNLHFI